MTKKSFKNGKKDKKIKNPEKGQKIIKNLEKKRGDRQTQKQTDRQR